MAASGILPALSLLIGATLGLNTGLGAWIYAALLIATCACALAFWVLRARMALFLDGTLGYLSGGAALAADACERALHSSIRHLLDCEFGGFLIESIGPAGRHDALPTRLLLVEDASRREGFVSLQAEIVAVRLHGQW